MRELISWLKIPPSFFRSQLVATKPVPKLGAFFVLEVLLGKSYLSKMKFGTKPASVFLKKTHDILSFRSVHILNSRFCCSDVQYKVVCIPANFSSQW